MFQAGLKRKLYALCASGKLGEDDLSISKINKEMVSRTSRLQNLELLNHKQIHKSYQFSPVRSGLGLPPLVSRSVNETSFLSDIIKSSPISAKQYDARPQSLEMSKGYPHDLSSKNGRGIFNRGGRATDRNTSDRIFHHSPRKSLDFANPLLTPSPS